MKNKEVCIECRSRREERTGVIGGVSQRYWKCTRCGDEVVDMEQLHEAAEKWRTLKGATFSKWGAAVAIRIPKELARQQKIRAGQEALIAPEKTGFRVIPQRRLSQRK